MKLFKLFILRSLQKSVRRFFAKNPSVKLIAVVGSVGKTSTKSTIVDILQKQFSVRTNRGNFNAELSAPLEILGVDMPKNPRSPLGWLRTIRNARLASNQPADIDVIVQEFGIDRPGEMTAFARYIRPNITVITAISPEHMEFFGDLETVAREEFGLNSVSNITLYNKDDIHPDFIHFANGARTVSYGTHNADYTIAATSFKDQAGFMCQLSVDDKKTPTFILPVIGEHQLRIAAGAAGVAIELGMDKKNIIKSLESFSPVPGRMQLLKGIHGATIIDDSYNSSPLAVHSALKTLYELPSDKKIAVLGDMNELGNMSDEEHKKLGAACNPDELDAVITVGAQTKKFTAPAAKQNGCTVYSFLKSPEITDLLISLLSKNTLILFKGSQGGIFLEEAIKPLLHDQSDSTKLVRQSPQWLQKKQRFFDE